MTRRAYPKYKDSGIPWLGEVPAHWEIAPACSRLTAVSSQVNKEWLVGREVFHYSIPVVQELGDGRFESGDDIDSGKNLLTQPTLLISKLNPRKGTIVWAIPRSVPTVCSGEFVCLMPTACSGQYAEYTYRSENVRQYLDSTVESVTKSHQRANPAFVRKLKWAWPPLPEQRAIAAFLDRETARIDGLIERKQRQIELLQEKRAALISHAVTKGLPAAAAAQAGLDPNAKTKPSGIEWLGDIPEHWEVLPIKRVAKMDSGHTPSKTVPEYWKDCDIPWVSLNDTAYLKMRISLAVCREPFFPAS